MKELVCNYALIRFLPYRETGEFVNIGVILYAPEVGYFNFQLTEKRNRRIRDFFPELNLQIYVAAVDSLRRELERQRTHFKALAGLFGGDRAVGDGLTAFRSMLRRRESLLHFAEPGMQLGVPEEILTRLYADYVLRTFAKTTAYQEAVLRNRLGGWLREWGLRQLYKINRSVGDEMYHVTLPFVHFDGVAAKVAIKPLDLNRSQPTEIYEHGGLWLQRFRRLSERKCLPERTVAPILSPVGPGRRAADEITRELNDLGVQTVDFNDEPRVRALSQI